RVAEVVFLDGQIFPTRTLNCSPTSLSLIFDRHDTSVTSLSPTQHLPPALMPHSLHSHSGQFCKHAVGSLEEVVLEAIRRGFAVYGLTEHVPRYRNEDLYPEEQGIEPADLMLQFTRFLDEAHRLKTKYAEQITLLVGLETEHITRDDVTGLEDLLRKHHPRVEYLVGSVHHVNAIPIDFDQATFRKAVDSVDAGSGDGHGAEDLSPGASAGARGKDEAFLIAYFDSQFELLERFKPEVVGHFDLCRLYTPSLSFSEFPEVLDRARRNIMYAIEYGALFEVNAAALRKNWETPYPGRDILEIIVASGGRLTLSDDSHGPHAVALNYGKIRGYLRSAGVSELWFLERSVDMAPNCAGRHVRPERISGDWAEHPFWMQFHS
ncbi:unnamed protein product, partial [Mycena citricolor]